MPLGMGDDCRLLLQPFDEYLAGFLKHVCKDRTCSSYNDYRKCRNRLAALLEYESRVKDIPFKELKQDFDTFVFKHKDISPSYRCASMSRAGRSATRTNTTAPCPCCGFVTRTANTPIGLDRFVTRLITSVTIVIETLHTTDYFCHTKINQLI